MTSIEEKYLVKEMLVTDLTPPPSCYCQNFIIRGKNRSQTFQSFTEISLTPDFFSIDVIANTVIPPPYHSVVKSIPIFIGAQLLYISMSVRPPVSPSLRVTFFLHISYIRRLGNFLEVVGGGGGKKQNKTLWYK